MAAPDAIDALVGASAFTGDARQAVVDDINRVADRVDR